MIKITLLALTKILIKNNIKYIIQKPKYIKDDDQLFCFLAVKNTTDAYIYDPNYIIDLSQERFNGNLEVILFYDFGDQKVCGCSHSIYEILKKFKTEMVK